MFAAALFVIALLSALLPILAQHKSVCPACGHLIVPDEEIVEQDGEWIHADCAEDGDR